MKLKFIHKAILIFITSLFLFNCAKKEDSTIALNLEVEDFVWKGLNAFYLWQSDIPDLADTRFTTQTQLNNYLSDFSSPENLFESLLNRPTDRFSWIVDDYIALENSFQGITLNNGMEFGIVRFKENSSNLFCYVRYVIPNSDAANKNITRGMLFSEVDGTQITETNFRSLLFGENDTYTIGLANYNDGNPETNGTEITLVKAQIQENPIAVSKVITAGASKIGYLMYNQFASSFDAELNAVFANFKSENINDLIIDLRYNGGGSVRTATYLGAMVTGQFDGELFSKQVWNEKVLKAFDPSNFTNNFTNQINHDNLNETINNLNLTRVYFIVSDNSASASELLINSLSPYIDVKLVGSKTVGKQVGSITLYDSEDLTRDGANLNQNHNYAMQPIVLEIANKDDQNHPEGFTPGITLPGIVLTEDFNDLGVLGERTDPLLDRTIVLITTGAKTDTKSRKIKINHEEISSSKMINPSKNNMYVDLK